MRPVPINKKIIGVSIVLLSAATLFIFSTSREVIDFNTQVKPIFNKKCISCHGGVKRQSGFSLLFRTEAMAKAESGKYAIIPGDPEHSELIRRVKLDDPEDRMPYKHPPLSEEEITVLQKWIKQGANWGNHWAYVPVKQQVIPTVGGSFFSSDRSSVKDWPKNDIDRFIMEKWEPFELKGSPEADKATLARRISLDITGTPLTENETAAFAAGKDANDYEQLVDKLLASPHYGEKWASAWLDLARYADTKGFERDDNRTIWHYRDWLIKAFNDDKRYDRFLTEQIAGDLLPDYTEEDLIATAFHRNTMTNDEGGTDNEEFRTAAVIDRVNTTWQGLLGTSFSCVQCHSHPYDPFSHDEYYKFMAFFNDTRDEDTFSEYPVLRHFSEEDSLTLQFVMRWFEENKLHKEALPVKQFLKTWQPAINSLLADQFVNSELADTKWLIFRNEAKARLKSVTLDNKSRLIFRHNAFQPGGVWQIRLDSAGGKLLASISLKQTKGWAFASIDFPQVAGTHDLHFSYTNPQLKKPDQSGVQFDWFYFTQPLPGKGLAGYDTLQKAYWNLLTKNMPVTPVMMENPQDMFRSTQVFERGNWLVKGKTVEADVPHSLNPLPPGAPRNRLGLARWLTSKQNPLTARTLVNRVWEQLFGTGLVETLEDMGTQGATPTHPELLDYLSYRFMNDLNWSVKGLIREILLSATYRQDSQASAEALEKDPVNRWYARGSRVRLSAEQLRDQALFVSGLISDKMYGAPVMPWQPKGIWMSPYNGRTWDQSKGEDQYRRSVYTFYKRTAPYPSLVTFDGVSREFCTVRRIRTNTPLQALVTMNDSVYIEAGRHLAWRMLDGIKGADKNTAIATGYQYAMQKDISPAKLAALRRLYDRAYTDLQKDKEKTCEVSGLMDKHNNPESAAMVVVAEAILNLDEFITRN